MFTPYTDDEEIERMEHEKKMSKGGRKYTCPTCKEPNKLTLAEHNKGYQCDECADRAEAGIPGY